MKQQTKRRKKKKQHQQPTFSRASSATADYNNNHIGPHAEQPTPQQEQKLLPVVALMEAFDSFSFQQVSTACKQANGDVNRAAEILANLTDDTADDPSSSSVSSALSASDFASSSTSSTSSNTSTTGSTFGSSSDGFMEDGNMLTRKGFRGGNKHKRVVAVTGTVSTVLGKEYVKASPRRDSTKSKDSNIAIFSKEDAEQFLCSMLSDDSELSMAVVRDVFCQCGYDVEKALDVLLDLSTSSYERSRNDRYLNDMGNCKDDNGFVVDHFENVTDRASDCTTHSAESEVHESIWGYDCRNYSEVVTSSEPPSTSQRIDESNLPQKVLESLFNIPRSSEREPGTMNWRNVAKKMQLLGPVVDSSASNAAVPQQGSYAEGSEYHLFRQSAKQHWDSMRSYYQKAAVAYSKGERQYAAYLSDQGKVQTKLAREADERASKDIFKARNKDFENVITIDFHGQHVKEAMRLLKLHLLFGTYVRSVQTLRVITGCGSHGLGKSKLKQTIIMLLEKEGIRWSEENRGTLLIKLDGIKEYSFLDSDSDTE